MRFTEKINKTKVEQKCSNDYIIDDFMFDIPKTYKAIDKLGQYEDIDEDPAHLAKVNKAFKILIKKDVRKSHFIDCLLYSENDEQALLEYNRRFGCNDDGDYTNKLTKEEFDILKEVFL